MKIAILGSGGREHALTFSISKSNKVKKIYCIPGNAGTSSLAENISIDINNFETVYLPKNDKFLMYFKKYLPKKINIKTYQIV